MAKLIAGIRIRIHELGKGRREQRAVFEKLGGGAKMVERGDLRAHPGETARAMTTARCAIEGAGETARGQA
ncbi:MAG: hypothetical protein ACREJB_09885, partial [Planctomycetaceae bacterium]